MSLKNYYPLPFYNSASKQHRKLWYSFERIFPYPILEGIIPPFQFDKFDDTGETFSSFILRHIRSGVEFDISTEIDTAGLAVYTETGYDKVVWKGVNRIDNPDGLAPPGGRAAFPMGDYEAELTLGANTYTSETFRFVETVDCFLKVEWWHDENFEHPNGFIKYDTAYKNFAYFPTEFAKPSYPITREISERQGRTYPRIQTVGKTHRCDILVPEWLADCLSLLPLHHYVEITYEGTTYAVNQILTAGPDWLDRGDLGTMELEVTFDNSVVKTGKAKL